MKKPFCPTLVMLFVCVATLGHTVTADEESTSPPPQPRLTVSEDLSHPSSVQGCLSAACEATNAEDLDAFLECFTTGARKKLRKPAAILFVQHDIDMEIVEHNVVQQTGNRAQAVVKYGAVFSGSKYAIVSLVDFRKEGGYWKIAREDVQMVENERPASCTVSRFACLSGHCGLGR